MEQERIEYVQKLFVREMLRDIFETGYSQGHNDTVEGHARDMREASKEYIDSMFHGLPHD